MYAYVLQAASSSSAASDGQTSEGKKTANGGSNDADPS